MNGVKMQVPNVAVVVSADSIPAGIAAVAGATNAPELAQAAVWNHASNAPVTQPAHSLSARTPADPCASDVASAAQASLRHNAANPANAIAADSIPASSAPTAGAAHAPRVARVPY